ncbi:LemA family protein [Alkaliphilus metalliredigens QYMF]|uniref:LemA family protein n=1 Tax=Alkaliphilus metalliredigens (strain QYMF) TaxID=293826 RepID=A6TS06_ALKMQ|nr:LemA family protein [Alkaliphilus metalliredigens]ABR48974.1 LemA family protein [Alkaliphilus metalliredigens QYMF]
MKKTWIIVLVIVALVIAIPAISITGSYNKLVGMDESVNANWQQVENLMQRRYDLIPNLVEVTKGYASHEEQVFTEIANARARIGQGSNREDMIDANQELTGALSRLLVLTENYPQLQASEQFVRLQDELAGTENRLAVARQDYNNSVRDYNDTIRRFPTSLLANNFGFDSQPYFEMSSEAGEAPQVNFN